LPLHTQKTNTCTPTHDPTIHELTFTQTWPVALLLLFGNILLAWVALKFYDEPLRKLLSRRKH
jgi:peptidoglycan/LPS O-acetylase OafA/YrhL